MLAWAHEYFPLKHAPSGHMSFIQRPINADAKFEDLKILLSTQIPNRGISQNFQQTKHETFWGKVANYGIMTFVRHINVITHRR